MSNFFFSHNVFKRLLSQTCKNQGLFGKVLLRGESFPTQLVVWFRTGIQYISKTGILRSIDTLDGTVLYRTKYQSSKENKRKTNKYLYLVVFTGQMHCNLFSHSVFKNQIKHLVIQMLSNVFLGTFMTGMQGRTSLINQVIFSSDLTLSQTSNFRLFQIERVCRWQLRIW